MALTPFFVVTALLEIGAGVALLVAPALVISLLFGPSVFQTIAIARLAGAALVALGAASWWARHDGSSAASSALVGGLLIYNAAVVALVLSGSLGSIDLLLWAVVVVHGAMGLWCVWLLRVAPVRAPV